MNQLRIGPVIEKILVDRLKHWPLMRVSDARYFINFINNNINNFNILSIANHEEKNGWRH